MNMDPFIELPPPTTLPLGICFALRSGCMIPSNAQLWGESSASTNLLELFLMGSGSLSKSG